MNIKYRNTSIIAVISLFFIIWMQREIFAVNNGFGYILLEIIFTICMLAVFTSLFQYLLIDKDGKIYSQVFILDYIMLLLVQTVAFMPFYTQNFMYGDDLWDLAVDFNGSIHEGIYFSRLFMSFMRGALLDTSPASLKFYRLYSGLFLWLFGCVIYRFMVDAKYKKSFSFCVSALSISGCAAVDCIAYAAVAPINSALCFSAISYVLYYKAREYTAQKKRLLLAASALCLFSAFNLYQIGTPIVFVMYMIAEANNHTGSGQTNRKRGIQAFKYLIFYGFVAIIYFLSVKLIQNLTGVLNTQAAVRTDIAISLEYIIAKINWFFKDVCPQTICRIVALLFGNSLYTTNNMFYNCSFSNNLSEIILKIIVIGISVWSIIYTAYKQKSFIYIAIAAAVAPLSFWVFLVLPESTYLTYYAMPIIIFLLFLCANGLQIIFLQIAEKCPRVASRLRIKTPHIVGFVIIIAVLQSNNYAENAWVNYSRDSYEYIANTISARLIETEAVDTIVVQGRISPYVGGRNYVIFLVQDILRELGKDPTDYYIYHQSNGSYVDEFNDSEVKKMESILGTETMNRLKEYYYYGEMYSLWYYRGNAQTQEDLSFLRDCFIKTGQLPEINDTTVYIDMTGFNARNQF